ncbi:MAG: hypothetical protein FWF51_08015 [Chitinivibrionia bacterium]|nr:hypothetical protein [Chitinivibrionia bacterium]
MFIQDLGDYLIDLSKIFAAGMVVGGIMADSGDNFAFVVWGGLLSICAFITGSILRALARKINKRKGE